jgi:2-polyprenyl-6-methoxyphenol hydroxylase-like FAD-dependent oxidoreductase
VRFVHSALVEQLLVDVTQERVEVRGVELKRHGMRELLEADVVIDTSGKHTRFPEQLAALGVKVDSLAFPSDRIYVCRHYRLHDPAAAPRRTGTGANLDYFGYATFYAEHGHYAITLSCPVEEQELARYMARASGFDAICAQLPGLAEWIRVSYPTSKVLGAGRFANRWTTCGAHGGPALHGYFAVGDSHIETNPMYGRGCAAAFVQAGVLAEVLATTPEVTRRLARYERGTRERMQAHFDFCKQTDDIFRTRGRLSRTEPITRAERALCYAYDEAWTPAMERSPLVAREMIKAMQMRELSPFGVRCAVLVQIVLGWLSRRLARARPVTPQLGPGRSELMRVLHRDSEVSGAHALHTPGELDEPELLEVGGDAEGREDATVLRRNVRQRS